jgi:hypothetical protein
MVTIRKINDPSYEQLRKAIEFSAEHWEEINPIFSQEKFLAWKKLRVQLVLAQEKEEIQGSCFILPYDFSGAEKEAEYVWLFNMVVSASAKNLGALLLLKIMNWYPAVMCIGVTEQAAKIYEALRWKKYVNIWRCVHPICFTEMVEHYEGRLGNSLKRQTLKIAGILYNNIMYYLESLLALIGQRHEIKQGKAEDHYNAIKNLKENEKLKIISSYCDLSIIKNKDNVLITSINGIGRIIKDNHKGFNRILAHARLWHELRYKHSLFCEYIVTSKKEKMRAYGLGYIPVEMPIFYHDKKRILTSFFQKINESDFSFLSCDKLL